MTIDPLTADKEAVDVEEMAVKRVYTPTGDVAWDDSIGTHGQEGNWQRLSTAL